MPRSPFFALLLSACCMLPAMALELSQLRFPFTRAAADKQLSRDYSFCVLKDMSIRRTWELSNRTVSVDFTPKDGDRAILIFIDYTTPVSPAVAHEDAAQMLGFEPDKWQAVSEKRALRLGMEAAEGFKVKGGHYCFRELDARGNVLKLAYYADAPNEVRWDLARDAREDGKTALGTRASAGASELLWQDEERRRGVSASSSSSSLASAAAAVVAGAPGKNQVKPQPAVARPEESEDFWGELKGYAAALTPEQYAIGGGVLALLVLWRVIANMLAARKRAIVTGYIMSQHRRPTSRRKQG